MAANDRSTPLSVVDSLIDKQRQDRQRTAARKNFGIGEELAGRIGDMDSLCQFKAAYAENLCQAIEALASSEGPTKSANLLVIKNLANQAAYWTMDLANDVNGFAEDVGCNIRSSAEDHATQAP